MIVDRSRMLTRMMVVMIVMVLLGRLKSPDIGRIGGVRLGHRLGYVAGGGDGAHVPSRGDHRSRTLGRSLLLLGRRARHPWRILLHFALLPFALDLLLRQRLLHREEPARTAPLNKPRGPFRDDPTKKSKLVGRSSRPNADDCRPRRR